MDNYEYVFAFPIIFIRKKGLMEKYLRCDICGHTYPLGHYCLTCRSNNLIGTKVQNHIVDFVKILKIKPDDTLIIKGDLSDSDLSLFKSHLKENKITNPTVFINSKMDIIVLRKIEDNND